MVKGTTQRVVVVRAKGGALFDEAIFLIRPGMEQKCAVTDQMLLDEARRAAAAGAGARRRMEDADAVRIGRRGRHGPLLDPSAFCCRGGRSTAKVLALIPQSARSVDCPP